MSADPPDLLLEELRLLRRDAQEHRRVERADTLEQRKVTRQLVEVLRDLREEVSALRLEVNHLRTKKEKDERLRALEAVAGAGGT